MGPGLSPNNPPTGAHGPTAERSGERPGEPGKPAGPERPGTPKPGDHKRNLHQARDGVNRMMKEVEALLESPEPDYQRPAKLLDLLETTCRSGFNNAYEIQ